MTRPGFIAQSSAAARTRAEIFRRHFDEKTLRPAESVKASMRCLACGGLFTYSASAVDGRMNGHCSSVGCLKWSD